MKLSLIAAALMLTIASLQAATKKPIPADMEKNYWDCDFAIATTIQPMGVMEECDMIVTHLYREFFDSSPEKFMVWHRANKTREWAIRKGSLVPGAKKLDV